MCLCATERFRHFGSSDLSPEATVWPAVCELVERSLRPRRRVVYAAMSTKHVRIHTTSTQLHSNCCTACKGISEVSSAAEARCPLDADRPAMRTDTCTYICILADLFQPEAIDRRWQRGVTLGALHRQASLPRCD